MQQDLQQPDDPSLVNLDAGIAHRTDGDGQGKALEQREVHVHVQPLRLEVGEAIGDGQKFLAHRVQVVQPFAQAEVAKVVGAEFVPEKSGELLVLRQEGAFPVGPEDIQ